MIVRANIPGLLHVFRQLEGRRLLRAVDGFDCVELVFDGEEGNLVSIYPHGTGDPHDGDIMLGFISPMLVRGGYGKPGGEAPGEEDVA